VFSYVVCGLLLALFLETEFILNSVLMTYHCFSIATSYDRCVCSGDDLSVCKGVFAGSYKNVQRFRDPRIIHRET
jgi:hypothetical protein